MYLQVDRVRNNYYNNNRKKYILAQVYLKKENRFKFKFKNVLYAGNFACSETCDKVGLYTEPKPK